MLNSTSELIFKIFFIVLCISDCLVVALLQNSSNRSNIATYSYILVKSIKIIRVQKLAINNFLIFILQARVLLQFISITSPSKLKELRIIHSIINNIYWKDVLKIVLSLVCFLKYFYAYLWEAHSSRLKGSVFF